MKTERLSYVKLLLFFSMNRRQKPSIFLFERWYIIVGFVKTGYSISLYVKNLEIKKLEHIF